MYGTRIGKPEGEKSYYEFSKKKIYVQICGKNISYLLGVAAAMAIIAKDKSVRVNFIVIEQILANKIQCN